MNTKYVKWLGLVGAIASGASLIASGQVQEGVGLIFASLSSAGILSGAQK